MMGVYDNNTQTENVAEDGVYIAVTTSLVESNYICVLGPEYVSNFISRDLVIRANRVDMMNYYKVRKW